MMAQTAPGYASNAVTETMMMNRCHFFTGKASLISTSANHYGQYLGTGHVK
jgi:hypothetical protein